MKDALLARPKDGAADRTLGHFLLFEGLRCVMQCCSLELPWRGNERKVSCIPDGKYRVVRRYSQKYTWHYLVKGVDGRDLILIHAANWPHELLGCIALGRQFSDLDKDGVLDLADSKSQIKKLLELAGEEFELTIITL